MSEINDTPPDTETDSDLGPQETVTPEAPPKPRRGRPPKDPNAVKTEKISKDTGPSVKPRKRATYDPQLLSKQLFGIHKMASQMTGLPELQIDNDESMALANSIIGVSEQYDLSIDGKTGAAIQLLATAAMIYGPRLLYIKARAQAAKNNVVDVP